jgi:hypothetical protein
VSDDSDNGLRAFQALGRFLEEDGWYPQRMGDRLLYRLAYAGDSGQVICFVQVEAELELMIVYVYAPVKAPEARRPAVAEFIVRANYGIWIGNFELDYADGEIRYKGCVDFEGTTLGDPQIRNTIYASVRSMDRYLPGLMDVIYGNTSPAEAIASVEGKKG